MNPSPRNDLTNQPSESYHCARGATASANSPAARARQHVTTTGVVPAHQIGLDRILTEHHCHGIVDVCRRNIAVRVHAPQSLNQSLFDRVDHHVSQMVFTARLYKGR